MMDLARTAGVAAAVQPQFTRTRYIALEPYGSTS